jgi:hypothetical protein
VEAIAERALRVSAEIAAAFGTGRVKEAMNVTAELGEDASHGVPPDGDPSRAANVAPRYVDATENFPAISPAAKLIARNWKRTNGSKEKPLQPCAPIQ